MSNPAVWAKTAVIISYDENGGFFDHVTPPPGTAGEYIPQSIVGKVTDSGGIGWTNRPGLPGAVPGGLAL